MSEAADVIVIGGGINGAAIAFNLAKRGARVALVEKRSIASGPTGRSVGTSGASDDGAPAPAANGAEWRS